MAHQKEKKMYEERLAQVEKLEKAGINPYPAEPPARTHKIIELNTSFENIKGTIVSVVGRVLAKRVHGGVTFFDIDDATGKIQVLVSKNNLGDTYITLRDNFEAGDFIATTGALDKTKAGEITVIANLCLMLAKALRPQPLKINNQELQFRRRYLHTLIDSEVRNRFRVRSRIVQFMRDYFLNKLGAIEVETPILDTTYGGAQARPFETKHWALGTKLYLRISNELYLKRLTVGGYYEGVFEFSRDFRNEGMDKTHNPEFTQVELYMPFWDYKMMMDTAEDLMSSLVLKIHGTTKVKFGEYTIDFAKPWKRISVFDGLKEKLGIDPQTVTDSELKVLAKKHGIEGSGTRGEILLDLFEKGWDKDLIQPTFVYDFPVETSSLTKKHRENPNLAERFEMYAGGIETMNSFTELNDPRDQRKRFELEEEKRKAGDKEAMPYDEDYILAQEYGMPPQSGIGISIDRWTMLLTDTHHIRQAIYFPTLKVEGEDN